MLSYATENRETHDAIERYVIAAIAQSPGEAFPVELFLAAVARRGSLCATVRACLRSAFPYKNCCLR